MLHSAVVVLSSVTLKCHFQMSSLISLTLSASSLAIKSVWLRQIHLELCCFAVVPYLLPIVTPCSNFLRMVLQHQSDIDVLLLSSMDSASQSSNLLSFFFTQISWSYPFPLHWKAVYIRVGKKPQYPMWIQLRQIRVVMRQREALGVTVDLSMTKRLQELNRKVTSPISSFQRLQLEQQQKSCFLA